MSWSVNVTIVPKEYDDHFVSLKEEALKQNSECGDQFDAAAAAVWEIIHSKAIGDPKKHSFAVTMVGHSNPDHEPREGWANDFINVSITQAS